MGTNKFGPWLPDFGALVTEGVTRATNVLPAPDGFDPVRRHTTASGVLPSRPLGAFAALSNSLATFQYAGTVTKLFLNIAGMWTDRSRSLRPSTPAAPPALAEPAGTAYAATSEGFWDFVQWGNLLFATNGVDYPQMTVIGAATPFDDIKGVFNAKFPAEGWQFRARYCCVVRNHLIMAHLQDDDDPEGVSARPSRVKWSGFNNEQEWIPDPSTLSDYEDLKASKIVRIFGGEYGVIFQSDAIWKMSYVGAPAAFQFDEVVSGVGLIAPGAAVQIGDTIFFWSQKGFYALTAGQKLTPIGANKVDDFAVVDLDKSYTFRISAAADPQSQQIHWLYPGGGSASGEPNRRLVFDTATGGWSLIIEDLVLMWATAGVSRDLDATPAVPGDPDDLDAPDPVSLDDPRWIGEAYALAAFDPTFRSGFFDGANLAGEIETPEYAFNGNGRARLHGFRPLIEGGIITAQVGTRNSLSENVSYGPELTTSRDLRIYCRTNARYHRIRFKIDGDWDHAMGWETEDRDLKMGEGRG